MLSIGTITAEPVEAEASRLSGLAVHVNGPIDARLLPSPVITLHDVDAGEAGHQPRLRAGMLKVELALGPLAPRQDAGVRSRI